MRGKLKPFHPPPQQMWARLCQSQPSLNRALPQTTTPLQKRRLPLLQFGADLAWRSEEGDMGAARDSLCSKVSPAKLTSRSRVTRSQVGVDVSVAMLFVHLFLGTRPMPLIKGATCLLLIEPFAI